MRGAYERIVLGHDDGREDSAGLLKRQATLFDCYNYQVISSRGLVSCFNVRNKNLPPDARSLLSTIRQSYSASSDLIKQN